jgi:hypothetical protein
LLIFALVVGLMRAMVAPRNAPASFLDPPMAGSGSCASGFRVTIGSISGEGGYVTLLVRSPASFAVPATAVRLGAGVLAAVGVAHLQIIGRPATICPLRALTGIPCPLCGGTTAAVRLGRFDVAGALAANPVAVLFGIAFIATPLLLGRGGLDRLSPRGRRNTTRAVIVALAFSEVWQLVRFGVW